MKFQINILTLRRFGRSFRSLGRDNKIIFFSIFNLLYNIMDISVLQILS